MDGGYGGADGEAKADAVALSVGYNDCEQAFASSVFDFMAHALELGFTELLLSFSHIALMRMWLMLTPAPRYMLHLSSLSNASRPSSVVSPLHIRTLKRHPSPSFPNSKPGAVRP